MSVNLTPLNKVETERQILRLEEIFGILDKPARGKKCPAIEGIIEGASEIMKEAEDDTVRDAGMLAAAQAVEHYEISRYGTLKSWAEKLELDDVAGLLNPGGREGHRPQANRPRRE